MNSNEEIQLILPILKNGGSILYPTDTIWGIGCDACNVEAVEQIFQLKQRDKEKGFVLLVDSNKMLHKYVAQVHPKIQNLLDYHTRPVTVIYEQAKNLPQEVVSNDGSIAIRIVQDQFCKDLIKSFGRPIVSTSANISNEPSPTHFEEVTLPIKEGVDYIVTHRQDEIKEAQPSVIVKLSKKNELNFIRK